jgi:aconitate hydratase
MIAAGARMLESSCGPCIGMVARRGAGRSRSVPSTEFQGPERHKDALSIREPCLCAVAVKEIVDPRESDCRSALQRTSEIFNKQEFHHFAKGRHNRCQGHQGPNIKEVSVERTAEGLDRCGGPAETR